MPSRAFIKWAPRVGAVAARERQRSLRQVLAAVPLTVIGCLLIDLGLIKSSTIVLGLGSALIVASFVGFLLSLRSALKFQQIAGRYLGVDTRGRNFIPAGDGKYIDWYHRNVERAPEYALHV